MVAAGSDPVFPTAQGVIGPLNDPCTSASLTQMNWLFAGPGLERYVDLTITPQRAPPCNWTAPDGTSRSSASSGGLHFPRFGASTAQVPFLVQAIEPEITPKLPPNQTLVEQMTPRSSGRVCSERQQGPIKSA